MSTEYFNDQWRIPSNENQNKISNYSMEFDNVANNSISLGNTLTNGFSKLTVSVWANFSSLPGTARGLISKDLANQRSFEIRYNTSGVDFIVSTNGTQIFSSSVYPRNSINIGQWYHFVGVYDGSNILFYVDGTLIGTPTALTGSLQNTTSELNIGLRSASPSNTTFDGKIDQVSIFDYALPATGTNSVATLYGGGTAVTNPMALSPKPIAAYQLGDQSVDNGANYLVPNNSLSDYVFNFSTPALVNFGTTIANFDRTDPFTFSIWIKTSSNATNQYVISKQIPAYLGSMILLDSNMRLGIILSATATNRIYLTSNSAIPSNEWVHLAWTYDGSSSYSGMSVYINGSPFATSVVNDSLTLTTVNTGQLNISGRDGSSHREVNGELSSFSIFDTELTSNEVNSIYNNGSPNDISSLNPIAWYKLNNSEIFNNTSTEWSIDNNAYPSVYKSSLNFDGSNDYIDLGTTTSYDTGDLSAAIWVKITNTGSTQYIFSNSGSPSIKGFDIKVRGSNEIGVQRYNPTNGAESGWFSPGFVYDAWQHLAFTYEESTGTIKTFLNGNLVATNTGTSTATLPSVKLTIGSYKGVQNYANGELSNAAIFSSKLEDSEIATLYNNGTPEASISHSPVSWWKLDNTTTGLLDSGSASNNGTNNGATEYAGFVNALAGESYGMDSSNLVVSDLQQTSGYSPYALDFSGITAHLKTYTTPAATNTVTLSAWVKRTGATGSYAGVFGVRNSGGSPDFGLCWQLCFFSTDNKIQFRTSSGVGYNYILTTVTQNDVMPDNTWTHVVGVADGTNIKIYINGVLQTDIKTQTDGTLQTPSSNILFAAQGPTGAGQPFNGQLSNCARWNIGLTQAEVTEIYNQGVPSNLNTFSGTAPIGWWQLGSNSSFEGDDWTCLDEIGTDYADSGTTAMSNDDIVDGPGYSASGVGTSSIDIKGDAPYSTANGLSENMDVLNRSTEVPS